MTDNQKFFTGLAIGAAAGAAIVLLLSSEKGKDILHNIKDFAGRSGDSLKDFASKSKDSIHDGIESFKDEVSDLWNEAKNKADENLSKA